MVETLFFVHSDEHAAEQVADEYRSRGWNVVASSATATDAVQRIAQANPVAAVFCLDGDCAEDVRSLARDVATNPDAPRPLLVFVGGSAADVGLARADAPYGVFVHHDELPWVLKRLAVKS